MTPAHSASGFDEGAVERAARVLWNFVHPLASRIPVFGGTQITPQNAPETWEAARAILAAAFPETGAEAGVVVARGLVDDGCILYENGLISFYGIKQHLESAMRAHRGRRVRVVVVPEDDAGVAQSVEQETAKLPVAGSSPATRSTYPGHVVGDFEEDGPDPSPSAACRTCGGSRRACKHCIPHRCDCDGQPSPCWIDCPSCAPSPSEGAASPATPQTVGDLVTLMQREWNRAPHLDDESKWLLAGVRVLGLVAAKQRAVEDAVAKERERCATVAERNHPNDGECCYEDPDGHCGRVSECEAIAAAIRGSR